MMGGISFSNLLITLLRVIPTMTSISFATGKSSGILSDIIERLVPFGPPASCEKRWLCGHKCPSNHRTDPLQCLLKTAAAIECTPVLQFTLIQPSIEVVGQDEASLFVPLPNFGFHMIYRKKQVIELSPVPIRISVNFWSRMVNNLKGSKTQRVSE